MDYNIVLYIHNPWNTLHQSCGTYTSWSYKEIHRNIDKKLSHVLIVMVRSKIVPVGPVEVAPVGLVEVQEHEEWLVDAERLVVLMCTSGGVGAFLDKTDPSIGPMCHL